MKLGKKKRTVAGLDLGASSIKLVKLEERSGSFALTSLGMRELPLEVVVDEEIKDKDTVIFNLQSLVDQCDPKLKEVAISISGHGVITDKITMDQKSGAEAEQAILFEAEQRSPFDVEDVTMDYHVINENEEIKKMDVLLVAARNEFLNSYVELVAEAGLRPVIVDTDAFAIFNAYDINYELDPEKVTALMDIGFDTTSVTFLKNGLFHSTRDLASGGRLIYNSIMKEFRINQELAMKTIKGEMGASIDQDMLKATVVTASEELISGLEVAFSYFKSTAKVPQVDWIVLSGGGALIPFLPEFIQSKLNVPIEVANPLRNIEYDPEIFKGVQPDRIAPLLAVSVGLASRKAE
jgi:type IV pilus assembly protein PilM